MRRGTAQHTWGESRGEEESEDPMRAGMGSTIYTSEPLRHAGHGGGFTSAYDFDLVHELRKVDVFAHQQISPAQQVRIDEPHQQRQHDQ